MSKNMNHLMTSLMERNSALAREKRRLVDVIRMVEQILKGIEAQGRDTGFVSTHPISTVRASLHEIVTSENEALMRDTGRRTPPSEKELAALARAEEGIHSYFTLIDPRDLDGIVNKVLNDIFPEPPKPKEDKADNGSVTWDVFPPKKKDWGVNFGGDLEGEWEDEEDYEDPLDRDG